MAIQLSLSKIVDAIGIPLSIKDGNITGALTILYTPIPGLLVPIPLRASKHFSADSDGVIFHVLGHLYLMVAHNPGTGVLSAFFVDASKLQQDQHKVPPSMMVGTNFDLKMTVKALRAGIVKSFVYRESKWSPFELPA